MAKILLVRVSGVFADRGEILATYFKEPGRTVVNCDPGPAGMVATAEIINTVKRERPDRIVFCYAGFLNAALAVGDLTAEWNPKPLLAIIAGGRSDLQGIVDAGFIAISNERLEGGIFPCPHLSEKSEVLKALGLV